MYNNTNKKCVNIEGEFITSVVIGERPVILFEDGDLTKTLTTSVVVAVHENIKNKMVFETQNSVYTVFHSNKFNKIALNASADNIIIRFFRMWLQPLKKFPWKKNMPEEV